MAKQKMAMRAQNNKKDGDKDVAAPAIVSNVLRSLVTDVIKAMTTAITNAMVPVAVTTKTITYYSAIHLYDKESFETNTKEGKYRCHLITKTSEGWKNEQISATVEHADKILELFKDSSVQLGL